MGSIGRAPGPGAPPLAAAIGGGGWGSRRQPQPQQASKKGEEGSGRRFFLPWSSKAAKPPAPSSSSSSSGQGWWPPRLPRLPALRRGGNWAVEELEEYEYEEGDDDDEGQHMLPRGALEAWGDGDGVCMWWGGVNVYSSCALFVHPFTYPYTPLCQRRFLGFVSMAARLLAVVAIVLALAFAPPPNARGGTYLQR